MRLCGGELGQGVLLGGQMDSTSCLSDDCFCLSCGSSFFSSFFIPILSAYP